MMSGIRGRDTRPEKAIRSGLHRIGFRFRLYATIPAGKPDLVLPMYRATVFVHGCFWHGHDCHLFRMPGSRRAFWHEKIRTNRLRDAVVSRDIRAAGWRQLVIWECAFKGRGKESLEKCVDRAARWIRGTRKAGEIRGARRK
jgi:DNA mismatch endonuclease (patch repair protein)